MSLRRAVAAPFRDRGVDRMHTSEFIVALSLDRNWFSPDQAERVVSLAVSDGLLERTADELVVSFDAADTTIPDGFVPDEEILTQRSTFERILDAVVDAGTDKRTAVAEINQLQNKLDVTIEAAAALYARRQGVDVSDLATRARARL
ncbi:MAG: uncharacterized protein conserved in archaea [halophilic archaeon J07HX5]|jgi:Uncharacterized protein conserved in archaea|nr:MAG: uncharacterized protein conserved in archaea [halophilic archaeon J07HX5]